MDENIEMRINYDDCIYVKYLTIETVCTSFDLHLGEGFLSANIASLLSNDFVDLKENGIVGIEIPQWKKNEKPESIISIDTSSNYDISQESFQSSKDTGTRKVQETKVWTVRATNLLIENRGDAEQDFNGNKKNNKIWDKISAKLSESGIVVSRTNCNIKFRNLMSTFRDNTCRANKSGEGCIHWEYYILMKKYFGKKNSVKPKKSTLIESSLTYCKHSKVETSSGSITSETLQPSNSTTTIVGNNSDDELEEVMPKMKKKKNFQETLLEEMKEDRKSRVAFQTKLDNFMEMMIKIETAKLEKLNTE
ncbi:uncharacterized protein LOC132953775 [Metopolophium dirhodum]|uniref:uncharacterized protein LOC132953775 n=1 Tax=Metopolophium dirhodum TaxID=44670 RepID=UPI00299082E2|nr:uncharacterized protein LOC132953775 [Metopolophium dirhodum]